MAKRKTRALSDKEVLKHYTAYEDVPRSSARGADAQKMLEQIRVSKPEFIKAVIAVDPVLTRRKSAVIRTRVTKSKTKPGDKHGKAKEK